MLCPIGTYKIPDGVNTLCTACGGPSLYCPISDELPQSALPGYCTYWSNPGSPTAFNPYAAFIQYFATFLVAAVPGDNSII
jgi:hypothetical protein